MGQKSNLLTLKTKNIASIFVSNPKTFYPLYYFIELLTRLFILRGVWVVTKNFQLDNNCVFTHFSLFFYNAKITGLKNKKSFKRGQRTTSSKTNSLFFDILKKYCVKYKLNSFVFHFKVLNNSIQKKSTVFLFKKLKYFMTLMFSRRFNLFVDFIKVTNLLIINLLSIDMYLFFLGQIFKNISHRLHNKFFSFIKTVFKTILNSSKNNIHIAGFKFIVAGRLRNKDRSSSRLLLLGSIPTHSFAKDISFSTCSVHTLYGVFGFKLWVFKKFINKKLI